MTPTCRRPTVRLAAVDPRSDQSLRVFICSIADDLFVICAKNSGIAWSVVMDRYEVQHPSALPAPRHLHAVPMVPTPEPEDMLTTRQQDMQPMAKATRGRL